MDRWNRASHAITHTVGTKRFFLVVCLLVAVWGVDGAVQGANRAWELSVTCGVPILTLLMVIVLQHAQNRDSTAVQLKLNELLLALEEPDADLVRAGRLGDEQLDALGAEHEGRIEGSAGR